MYTPHIGKIELYQTSGHYPYYKESQFPTLKMPSNASAKELLDGLISGSLDDDGPARLAGQGRHSRTHAASPRIEGRRIIGQLHQVVSSR